MRPELDQRFCGRCGEPCRGFEEAAPEIDPPRRCADCAIERGLVGRFFLYPAAWVAVVPVVIAGGLVLLDLIGMIVRAVEYWKSPYLLAGHFIEPSPLGPLILHLIFLGPLALLAMGLMRLKGEAQRRVEEIRRLDLGPAGTADTTVQGNVIVAAESAPARPRGAVTVPLPVRLDRWMRPGPALPSPRDES
ncbi:MAG: hypothetical protein HYY93_10675 [Planctomycetes bacterium]|nr:hypothetical protein [Planctomycetota bacterium]